MEASYFANVQKDWREISNRKRREFRLNHPEEARANDARWRAMRDKEKVAEEQRAWYLSDLEAHREEAKLRMREVCQWRKETGWQMSEEAKEKRRERDRIRRAKEDKELAHLARKDYYTRVNASGSYNTEERVAARKAARRRYKEKNRDMLRIKERDRKRAAKAAKKSECHPSGSPGKAADQVVTGNDFLKFCCG